MTGLQFSGAVVYPTRILFSLGFLALGLCSGQSETWSVASPDERLRLAVTSNDGALVWRAESGNANVRQVVVTDSPLGVKLQGVDLSRNLAFIDLKTQKLAEETYVLPHGKRTNYRARYNQSTLAFRGERGFILELDLRAYDSGVAFRYRVLAPDAAAKLTLESEQTGFGIQEGFKFWAAPSDKPSTYAPAYETYYGLEMAGTTPAPLGFGWSFPLLFRTSDSRVWGLITEAAVGPTFCGSRLSNAATNGVFTVRLPDPAEGLGHGDVHPQSTGPWQMPWRVLILGESLGNIVESTLVTDLGRPAAPDADFSWVKPGRVAWSWWSDNPSPKSASAQKKFIDLAAEMGWEYVLVDANWTIMEDGNIHDVLKYAKSKGVGVLLWYNSGGPHNVVTEKPRDCFTYKPVRDFELKMLSDWGVKGVKVDFFQSDKQDVIELYHGIMRDAAAAKIMVNFHGCTLPRGWERQYPNLMSMEGVRGEECYIFDEKYPEMAPVQNTVLPFTRNAVGPMDYTPVGLSDNHYPHLTTSVHELALAVIFESGWLHLTDRVEAYRALPEIPKQFLKDVPVTWDEVRFLDGYPGQYVCLARRHGNTWYLAAINGENKTRELRIKPGAWLGATVSQITTIADGSANREISSQTAPFKPTEEFHINLKPRGGFVGIIR